MATDPNRITEHRKAQREGKSPEERQAIALEQLADSFEAFRQDFVGGQFHIQAIAQAVGQLPKR